MTASTFFQRALLVGLTTLSLGAMASVAQAQAEVNFIKPENFSDIGWIASDRENAMKQLGDHFKALAARELPGKQLKIDVTDVDLAGEIEPRARIDRLRILRSVTIPRMSFTYTLSENGQVLKSGKADIKDMDYQNGIGNRYFDSEPLRYEKKMIDDWMAKELLGKSRIDRVSQ
ncbi:DUF3016 domain-containing protein [Mitsuaria sp. GD03876]|uniref:DUF3016 domain-containing protein n=1 Tax=Mitsuaria sp. GD03876 TaxID=2975399 RepID=UPI00244B0838|nr:DUF3016 domain-containing protein [Mitsuaria sp. GD03876]MDH0866574.1 DUF3016 domain-containing protein [Mitsuaria sp. GD03876]